MTSGRLQVSFVACKSWPESKSMTSGVRLSHQFGGSTFVTCGALAFGSCADSEEVSAAAHSNRETLRSAAEIIFALQAAGISIYRKRSAHGSSVAACLWDAKRNRSA